MKPKIYANGQAISLARMKSGLTISSLSKQIGMTAIMVGGVESGKLNPSPKTATKICEALKSDFDDLFIIE